MNLTFIGRGAMLYSEEGNTSAYIEDNENFFLIDCGEDVFQKLLKLNKLSKNKNYYVFITHTHSDHIGSLGTLITYMHYVLNNNVKIIYDENMESLDNVKKFLDTVYVSKENYSFINGNDIPKNEIFNKVYYIKTDHGKDKIKSCGIVFETNKGKVFYTGDNKGKNVITKFIEENNDIDKMYIDTSIDDSPVHLTLEELEEIIPKNIRNKVYCMHLNRTDYFNKIKELGFNYVSNINNLYKNDIFEILDNYNFDKNEFKIISSAALTIQGIKDKTSDIDIAVSKKLEEYLLNNYLCIYEKTNPNGTKVYFINDYINFSSNYYDVETRQINGYQVQTIEDIKILKENLKRDKDKYDLYLIDNKD